MKSILLLEDRHGSLVGVVFGNAAAAREWEDANAAEAGRGVARLLTRAQAVKEISQ